MIKKVAAKFPLSINDDGIMVLARNGVIMSCNEAAQKLFGQNLSPGDIFPMEIFFRKDDLERLETTLRDAYEKGREKHFLKADIRDTSGKRCCVVFSVQPLISENEVVIGVIICIKRMGTPLGKNSLLGMGTPFPIKDDYEHRALLEALPEGVFTINTSWRIASFNRTAEQITGFLRQEVIGHHCWDIFRSDLCNEGCPLRMALQTGQVCTDQDVRIIKKSGGRQTILVNTGVLRDITGNVVGAVETFRPLTGVVKLPKGIRAEYTFSDIIGKSPSMQRLFSMLPDIAASNANVLISGESGTGKDLLARTIHNHSPRRDFPFIAVNCSSLAESLLESELFGHEKSAFTGATETKKGRFELAKNGSLFLDEIGELKPELQVKLLRILENREFERVGGTQTIHMEARIISATNQDLTEKIKANAFREDFYYRLRTVPVTLPPLRDRREDIPLLVDFFIHRLNANTQKCVRAVDSKVMKFFMQYHWPGNIRELERTLEYAYVFVKGPVILPRTLPDSKEFVGLKTPDDNAVKPPSSVPGSRETIMWALSRTGGRRNEAAELLGMSRTSLWRRMKNLGIG